MLVSMPDKEIQRVLYCKTCEIIVLPKSVLLKSSIFLPAKLPGYTQAAQLLHISERQIRRLLQKYKA
ncbi:MAG: hypothetical protein ACN6NI_07650 [Acinetobacter sp.]